MVGKYIQHRLTQDKSRQKLSVGGSGEEEETEQEEEEEEAGDEEERLLDCFQIKSHGGGTLPKEKGESGVSDE